MNTFKRSSRDAAWLKLPVLAAFALLLTYLATDACYDSLPGYENATATEAIVVSSLAIGFDLLLFWYIARLIWPVDHVVSVSPSAVTLYNSSRPEETVTLTPGTVTGFYVRAHRWYHTADAELPLEYVLIDGSTRHISTAFLAGMDKYEFLDAVARNWAPEYVPARTTPFTHRRIRWWPPGLHPLDDAG